jgi:hypothetical protein
MRGGGLLFVVMVCHSICATQKKVGVVKKVFMAVAHQKCEMDLQWGKTTNWYHSKIVVNNLRGSTELDDATGHNCAMSSDKYTLFATLVLGLHPGETHGTTRSTGSFVNMLLEDFVSLLNLTAVFPLNESSDRKALARILARFSILLLGVDALTPTIVDQVWGQNRVVCKKLGGPCGNLALICRQLISLACVANKYLPLVARHHLQRQHHHPIRNPPQSSSWCS